MRFARRGNGCGGGGSSGSILTQPGLEVVLCLLDQVECLLFLGLVLDELLCLLNLVECIQYPWISTESITPISKSGRMSTVPNVYFVF